jgi:hypothetical protein
MNETEIIDCANKMNRSQIEEWLEWLQRNRCQGRNATNQDRVKEILDGYMHSYNSEYAQA